MYQVLQGKMLLNFEIINIKQFYSMKFAYSLNVQVDIATQNWA